VIFKGLKISHIKKHTRWQLYTMLLKSTKWIDVLSNIDPNSGYAHDCIDMVLVLLLHWWSTAFPFCVLDLDVESVEFG